MMSHSRDFFSLREKRLRRSAHFANALLALALLALVPAGLGEAIAAAAPTRPAPGARLAAGARAALVEIDTSRPLARFSPREALGAGLDGAEEGELPPTYTRTSLSAMSAAGLGALTYRLRTELGVEAWHFDPAGSFSDRKHMDGYWTGASRPASKTGPFATYGYALPRRGNTIDQADDSGYSRIDDGSLATFWKSNPYLDRRYTHEPEAAHAQWVMIDLGRPRLLDALRIVWAAPYAARFAIQRFLGGPDAVALAPGRWQDFPDAVHHGRPGAQTIRFSARPVRARFVRILMLSSSHTAPPGSRDVRDRLGYAISEVYLGTFDHGRFSDLLTHAPTKSQSVIYASSTDPWHGASDIDPAYEQPSFQTVLRSGLTRGAPLLVPVPVLYGTPANAVAELRYLRALGVRLRGVELGEEPDGQLTSPEDYGALYVRFARAIHRAFPRVPLGGPGFGSSLPDWAYWPDAHGDRSWTRRFIGYLRARRALGLLDFFSFEWYPFDDVCASSGPQLARVSGMLEGLLALQHSEGVPKRMPIYVTEYGYSSYAGQDEVEMPGALLNADTVGTLLSHGVRAAYLYGYEPNVPIRESRHCDTWGNLMLLRAGAAGTPPTPLASFWETRMLTREWALPGDRAHILYATHVSPGGRLVRAFALRRPDGRLSVLLLNMSPNRSYAIRLRAHSGRRSLPLQGTLEEWQLSSATYRWQAAGPNGQAILDRPPRHTHLRSARGPVELPPYSITVLRSARG
jgi:F5/8 type C domain